MKLPSIAGHRSQKQFIRDLLSSPETILDDEEEVGWFKASEMEELGYTNKEMLKIKEAFSIMKNKAKLASEKAAEKWGPTTQPTPAKGPTPKPPVKATPKNKDPKGRGRGKGRGK